MELHSLWAFHCDKILNSQILLANSLWNGCIHCNLQCTFWNWSKYTKSTIRKCSTMALSLNIIAHYITVPQDTSLYLKNSTYITIQMKVPLWNRSGISLWVFKENSKLQLQYNKFVIMDYLVNWYYLFSFTNLHQLKILLYKKETPS